MCLIDLLLLASLVSHDFVQTTARVSVDSSGLQGNGGSGLTEPSISAEGRFIAFDSVADNLVLGDTNQNQDVFVHDRQTGVTSRVSVDSAGVEGNGPSFSPSISADGRFIAFASDASRLVAWDTNSVADIFVHDRLTGLTTRVSVNSSGLQGFNTSLSPSISADGRYVAFASHAGNLVSADTNGTPDVFLHDRQTGSTSRVSVDSAGRQGNGWSLQPSLSADGRLIAFDSNASDLVPGDTNGNRDVFVHDHFSGATTRVSVDSAGVQANRPSKQPSISADGRHVAFHSGASNLVPADWNGVGDVFLHDLQTGNTCRISVSSAGLQGDDHSYSPSVSSDGRFVAFISLATNLIAGDANSRVDSFIHDRLLGLTRITSIDTSSIQSNDNIQRQSISSDGRYVAFCSWASNLVPGDTNGESDVFIHDCGPSTPQLEMSGNCHGLITLSLSNVSPRRMVSFIYGPAGNFIKQGPPCAGLSLGISPPTLGAVIYANSLGVANLNINLTTAFCGLSVQGVDLETCTASNLVVL